MLVVRRVGFEGGTRGAHGVPLARERARVAERAGARGDPCGRRADRGGAPGAADCRGRAEVRRDVHRRPPAEDLKSRGEGDDREGASERASSNRSRAAKRLGITRASSTCDSKRTGSSSAGGGLPARRPACPAEAATEILPVRGVAGSFVSAARSVAAYAASSASHRAPGLRERRFRRPFVRRPRRSPRTRPRRLAEEPGWLDRDA
jgi:hypothetical protein